MIDMLGITEMVVEFGVATCAGNIVKTCLNKVLDEPTTTAEKIARIVGVSAITGTVSAIVTEKQVKPAFDTIRKIQKAKPNPNIDYSEINN